MRGGGEVSTRIKRVRIDRAGKLDSESDFISVTAILLRQKLSTIDRIEVGL